MKKIALFILLCLTFCLAACKNKEPEEDNIEKGLLVAITNGPGVYDWKGKLICSCDEVLEISDTGEIVEGPYYKIQLLKCIIVLPDNVTAIGDRVFENCSGLTAISIPDSVTAIGDCAFDGCSGLTAISIPDSVTTIGDCAFDGCSGLTEISIPDSVKNIGTAAFTGCEHLNSITVSENNLYYDSRNNCNAIISKENNCLISGCKNTIIPDSVTTIGDYAFDGCVSLTAISIPDSVTAIGDVAFFNCIGLTAVSIPNSVTTIGEGAFAYCSGLTAISIPDSVTAIGEYAFAYCSGLTAISVPDSVTTIGKDAFDGCKKLKTISVSQNSYAEQWLKWQGLSDLIQNK